MRTIHRIPVARWSILALLAAALGMLLVIQPVFAQASPPLAPTGLTAKAVGLQTVELSWTAPDGTILGYKIQRSTATPEKWVDVTADTGSDEPHYSDTHSSLAGKTAFYRVAAINSLNTGPYFTLAAGVPLPTAGNQPDAPTGLMAKVSPTTAGTVDVSWTAPSRAASATTGYVVEWSANGKQPWAAIAETIAPATDTTVSNLSVTAGATRYYRVAATNIQGTGPYTTADVKVTTRHANVPSQPTLAGTNVVAVGLTTVELTWAAASPPVPTGAPPISGYRIERSIDSGATWTVVKANTDDDKLYYSDTHSSLAGKTVRYRVAAINGFGAGVFTAGAPASGLALPRAGRQPDAPTGLRAQAISTTAITVSWTAPAKTGQSALDDTTPYALQWSADGKQPWASLTTSGTDVSHDDTGLTAGATRYYRVAAINAQSTGPYTTAKVSATAGVPGAPAIEATNVVAVGLTTVELSWTAPTGATVTGYKIERSTVSGTEPEWITANANTRSDDAFYRDTHPSLAGKTVLYQVTSIGVNGPGGSAATTTGVALPTAGTQPGAPTALKAEVSPTDYGMVKLSWNAPTRGNAATGGYIVQWSAKDRHPWTALTETPSPVTDTTVTQASVPAGTTRYYRVAAHTGGNSSVVTAIGPYSTSVRVTTPKAGLPGAPTWPADPAMAVGLTTVEVKWDKPGDEGLASITGYKIERSTDGGKTWATAANNVQGISTGTTVHYSDTHPSLAGKKVRYRVAAINRIGTGPVSSVTTADAAVELTPEVTLPVADKYPGAPTGLTVRATSLTTATITWTAPEGEPEATGYIIQYSAKGELPWMTVGTGVTQTGASTTALVTGAPGDLGEHGVTQHYRVAATSGTVGSTTDPQRIGPYSAPATAGVRLTISGLSTVSYAESDTAEVGTYTARGENAASATWSLEGADADDFNISNAGVLTFRSSPDYENPADADGDNVYMVTVKATVGSESDTQDVTVTVTDVDETAPPGSLLERYDTDTSGDIDKDEAIAAINDYLFGTGDDAITQEQVIEVINLYLFGE